MRRRRADEDEDATGDDAIERLNKLLFTRPRAGGSIIRQYSAPPASVS
jgi:hypothetical protein